MRRKRIDFIFSIVFSTVLALMLWEARLWPPRTRLFPWSIGFFIFALSLLKMGVSLRALLAVQKVAHAECGTPDKPEAGMVSGTESATDHGEDFSPGRTVSILTWIVGFFLTIWLLGLRFGSLVATFAFLKGAAKESWRTSILLSVSTYLFFLLLFESVLAVALPSGLIATFLGGHSVDSLVFNWVWATVLR